MPKTINTKSLIEAWEEEKCLLDVSSVIYRNCYKKVKSRKKLAEPYCQNHIVAANFMLAHIESRIFIFVLVISS